MKPITDPFMLKPALTSDGRPWVQRCFLCAKSVDFLKKRPFVRVGQLVRHASCKSFLAFRPIDK